MEGYNSISMPFSAKQLHDHIVKSIICTSSENEKKSMAYLILDHVLSLDQISVIANKSLELNQTSWQEIEEIIERLNRNEPIQYVTGNAHFYGRLFKVNHHVLVPRSETEELVDLIVNENNESSLSIIDIGTGSGCIAISLQLEMDNANVFGFDIDPAVLQIAKKNATLLGASIEFSCFDILKDTSINNVNEKSIDIIVSNPPYVLNNEKKSIEKNVLNYEPHLALFVEDSDPIKFYFAIAKKAYEWLKPKGRIYFEINERFGLPVSNMLESFGFTGSKIIRDIHGKDRFVIANKN